MMKNKFTATVVLSMVAAGFVTLTTASQTRRTNDTKVITNSKIAVEKAQTKCSVQAYRAGFASDELKSSIVRAKPDKNSSIVKTVKTKDEVVFYITGSDGGGWFEISKIETTGGETDETVFEGRGWIHSSLVDLSVAGSDAKLYAAPRKKSRVLKKLVADESEARPIACQGDWMKVKSGKSIGWLSPDGQCPNPLTTCS